MKKPSLPLPSEPKKHEPWELYPHGSGFYAYSNCPVSFRLSQAAGPEPDTEESVFGSLVHAVLSAHKSSSEVSADVAESAADMEAQWGETYSAWNPKGEPIANLVVEHRIWFRENMMPLYSGKPDRFLRTEGKGKIVRVLLGDFKTGWQTLDSYPWTNCQLRAYVPLITSYYRRTVAEVSEVVAAIHKPGRRLAPAIFGPREIAEATEWSIDVARSAMRGTGEPNKGPWCRYCAGKVLCPAWRKEVSAFADIILSRVDSISDAALAEIAPRLDLAAQVVERLKERLFSRVRENPEAFPGWRIEPGDTRRAIEHGYSAFTLLVEKHKVLSLEEFVKATRASVSELKRAISRHPGNTMSLAAADRVLNDLLGPSGILVRNQTRARLTYAQAGRLKEDDEL